MKISERLAAIANMVPTGCRLADIGTDHAMLPVFLINNERVSYVVAGEANHGPYRTAAATVAARALNTHISVRLGKGLAILKPGEVEVVVIAGLGGATIIEILGEHPAVTCSLKRLVLQPMAAVPAVRQWLAGNGWRIGDEDLVQEDNKLYEIIMAQQGPCPEFEPILLEIGPILWQKKHPLLKAHIKQLISQYKKILNEIKGSSQAYHLPKYKEYTEKVKFLEDKYACL